MRRELQPGDVAMHANEFVFFTCDKEWIWSTTGRPCLNQAQVSRSARPLVVIDPESNDVERLQDLYIAAEAKGLSGLSMQAALREFADPKPPKPDEPTGLGAVVLDRDGSELVRVERDGEKPWRAGGGYRFAWDEIDVLAVNAPGAEPFADWEIDLLRGAR